MAQNGAQVYGRGIAFPPRGDARGRLAYAEGVDNVRESIRLILLTEPRERVMLPEFGAGLKRFLFRPNNAATHRLIEEAITRALGRWERRVRVDAVRVAADPVDRGVATATVRFTLVAGQVQDELQLRLVLQG